MQFEIKNRLTGAVQITAEIDCAADASASFKLGLAVRWAIKAKADLGGADLGGAYLGGAYLRGADLRGAYLRGAYLRGTDLRRANLRGAYLGGAYLGEADLRGADLRGAYLGGKKIDRLVTTMTRSDGYLFLAFKLQSGTVWITAGCRSFSLAQYRAHVRKRYANTPKGAETTDILDFIEKRAKAKAWS